MSSQQPSPEITTEKTTEEMPDRTSVKSSVRYQETLYVAWWGWPLPVIAAALLAAEVHLGYPGIRAWLPYLVMIPLAVALLIALGRVKIRVIGEELSVGKAHLPLRYIDDVEIITPQNKRKTLGPELDPAAFVVHRGWVGPLVKVRLNDPADPTPYWLFSSRRAESLAALLRERQNHQ